MNIHIVPVLNDNYAYVVVNDNGDALCVDPAEPDRVLQVAEAVRGNVKLVLTTHRHGDHSGGNAEMAKQIPGIDILGSAEDAVPAATKTVSDGEVFRFGNLQVTCIFTPCHTRGHVCYLLKDLSHPEESQAVFTGDTMFIGGCGRFFEGSADQMHDSLLGKLCTLSPRTRVFCGHEYTVSNLSFAKAVEPNNQAVQQKLTWAEIQRSTNQPTVPSTIAEELTYNPFLRVDQPAVAQFVRRQAGTDPIEVMRELRAAKDNWGVGAGR